MPKYVLTGVDGNLGGVAASFALDIVKPDQQLTFTTYKLSAIPAEKLALWKSKGVEIVEATYDDVDSLVKAFEGAEAITFISTWLLGDGRRQQARNVVAAAKKAGVKRVCYTSSIGAGRKVEKDEDLPFLMRDHHYVEGIVMASGLQWNFQRNCLYMDNIAGMFAQSWKFEGDRWLNNSHGKGATYVARDDTGRVAAALLLGRGEPNTAYDITGPEAVTDKEIFDWMNAQTGYKAEFVDMPDAELRKWWLDRGLPLNVYGDFSKIPMKLCIDDLMCCGEFVSQGVMATPSDSVEKLTGRKPLGYKEALLVYKDIFPRPE